MFVCAIEPLLCHLQNDKRLKGVFVPGSGGDVVKSVCYMDDLKVVCSSEGEVRRAELLLSIFGCMSGLNVNWSKSQACVVSGSLVLEKVKVKVSDSIDILGIHFEKNPLSDMNAERAMTKVSKKLDFWKLRRLSIYGKVLVVKAVVLPILLYFSVIFPPSARWIQKMTRSQPFFILLGS